MSFLLPASPAGPPHGASFPEADLLAPAASSSGPQGEESALLSGGRAPIG